jgi:anthranilate/para-aminobenzoate synthase component II
MFNGFPASLLKKMGEEPLNLHAHSWVVSTSTYMGSQALQEFYNVLAVDIHDGTEFVMAVEAKDYPISGVMHHPETQNIRIFGGDNSAL